MDSPQISEGIALLTATTALAWVAVGRLYVADRETAKFLQRLFLAAVLVRAGVALGTYVLLPYGALAPDQQAYVNAAKVLLASGPLHFRAALDSSQGWLYFNALLFHGLGLNPLLPRFWNCLVGGLTPVLSFALARRLGAGQAARWTAILVAFLPSLVLWSSLNLKDADVWFLVLTGLLLAVHFRNDIWLLPRIAGIGLILVILFSLRQFAAEVLALSALVALIAASPPARWIGSLRHPWRTVGAPIAVLVVLALAAGIVFPHIGAAIYKIAGLGQLVALRHGFGEGARSVTNADPGIGTLAGALRFLPSGVVDYMLRPFPWEHGTQLAVLTRPEAIAYYLLLVPAALGVLLGLRRAPALALPLVTYLVIAAVGYGLVISNLGTLYRERAPLVVLLFVFAGLGIGVLWPSGEAPAPLGRTNPLSLESDEA
jgi:hypothetical protein